MDFYFVLLAIFLILDGVSIQSTVNIPSGPSANAQNNSSVNLLSRPFVASYFGTIGRPNSQTYNRNIFLNDINPPSPHGGSLGSGPGTRPPGTPMRISEHKCYEFIGEIASTTIVESFSAARTPWIRCINVHPQSNKLVVGGEDSRLGEFPHMVALGRDDPSFSLMCGGTLISHTWVLSAAHCTYGRSGGVTHAWIGVFELSNSNEGTIYAIKNLIRHPDFNPPAKYADIALLQLVDSVPFTNLVRPACLYQAYDTVPRQAWDIGWGPKEFGGDNTDKMHKAHLDLVDNHACILRHSNSLDIPHGITPTMICAAGSGIDFCYGISGGPLQTLHKSAWLFQVIGISSFGRGCSLLNFPGVYTSVSHYIPWIESHVWP